MNNKKSLKLFGIEVFKYLSYDIQDVGEFTFYDIEFSFESMKQYNGKGVGFNLEHHMEIYNDDGTEVIWKGYAIDIPEFYQNLRKYKTIKVDKAETISNMSTISKTLSKLTDLELQELLQESLNSVSGDWYNPNSKMVQLNEEIRKLTKITDYNLYLLEQNVFIEVARRWWKINY